MVEPQPSKLVMRVRFPSSALMVPWLFRANIRAFDTGDFLWLNVFRAINGPSADRHQDARRAVIVVIFLSANAWLPFRAQPQLHDVSNNETPISHYGDR
jgi:hypothetical protein